MRTRINNCTVQCITLAYLCTVRVHVEFTVHCVGCVWDSTHCMPITDAVFRSGQGRSVRLRAVAKGSSCWLSVQRGGRPAWKPSAKNVLLCSLITRAFRLRTAFVSTDPNDLRSISHVSSLWSDLIRSDPIRLANCTAYSLLYNSTRVCPALLLGTGRGTGTGTRSTLHIKRCTRKRAGDELECTECVSHFLNSDCFESRRGACGTAHSPSVCAPRAGVSDAASFRERSRITVHVRVCYMLNAMLCCILLAEKCPRHERDVSVRCVECPSTGCLLRIKELAGALFTKRPLSSAPDSWILMRPPHSPAAHLTRTALTLICRTRVDVMPQHRCFSSCFCVRCFRAKLICISQRRGRVLVPDAMLSVVCCAFLVM